MIQLEHQASHHNIVEDSAPDLTPMLDIIFILLVFFILTYGSVFKSLQLNLPSAISQTVDLQTKRKHIMLEVGKDVFSLDGEKMVEFESLKGAALKAIKSNPEAEFIIAADKAVEIERLLKILTFLQSQDVASTNILMKQGKE